MFGFTPRNRSPVTDKEQKEMEEIPDHLASTYQMLKAAFPHGIADSDYLPLLAVLSEVMSDRNTADVISLLVDRPWAQIYNDVLVAQSGAPAGASGAERIKEHLSSFGYDAWLQDD